MLTNPLIPGFNPDPSIVRVGDTYYVVTSTFEYVPGIPVYASTDLVTWRHVSNVITTVEQGGLEKVPTGLGVWAPTIRYRGGRFYVIVTIALGRGCVVYSAESAEGPWDDGVVLTGVPGIDPDLAWDENGVAVVTFSGLYLNPPDFGSHHGIQQVDVDLASGEALSEIRDLWSGTGLMFPEAPHVYERGGDWYLMIAEGGTERGHGVSIARGPTLRGPFASGPANPFLSARSTTRPIQNTGHGDLVETPDGRTLMVLLGVRPRGMTRAFSALGRETFITEVTWVDGWPLAGPVQLNARPEPPAESISFDGDLDRDWMAVRRAPADIADLESRPGHLTLHGEGEGLDSARPVFLGRRQPHQTASVTVTIDASAGAGGLAVRYDEQTYYAISVSDDGTTATVTATAQIPGFTRREVAQLPSGPVELRLASDPPEASLPASLVAGATSDIISLVAASGGVERVLAAVDGRYLSAETACSFTGRVIGVFAESGSVGFQGWRYQGSNR